MLKSSLGVLACLFLVLVISGCTTRRYTQVQDRVDQEMVGNAGYIQGTPIPQDRSGIRKTRKTYVLEIQTKDKKATEEIKPLRKGTVEVSEESSRARPSQQAPEEPVVSSVSESPAFEEYTVMEGDTLQKISKKYYDSYRQWNKIYEANKEKIKNPDRIKPGTVLLIPKP